MPARLLSDDGRHIVVRPFVYVSEDEARLYTKEVGLPVIGCCCPVCGDLSLQRQRMKRLLMQLEREHPGVKASLLKALGNVMPRHLLDRRLNPPRAGVSGTTTAGRDPGPSTPSFTLGDEVDAGNPVEEHEPAAAVRVIPLIEQHAATGAAGGNGRHGSATRAAVRETHAGETIPAAE